MICIKCKMEVPDGLFCCQCGARQQKKPVQAARRRGNGAGTVIKRGKTYTAIVTIGGIITEGGKYKQLRKTKGGFRTKTEAYAYIPQLYDTTAACTFSTLWDTYKNGALKKLSQNKQTSYKTAADRWIKIMPKEVNAVSLGDLQKIMDSQVKTYYPAKDMQSVLSHMYQIAMAQQDAQVNLARMLTLPELVEEEPEPFTEIELHKIWTAYSKGRTILAGVLLMIYTGMMPGELLTLKAENVDMEKMEIRGIGLKTDCRREAAIVVPDLMAPILEYMIEHKGRTGKLVPINKWTWYDKYHETMQEIGVRDLPPYSCRHTTATALALGNVAPSAIQEVMRHSKFKTTQRYIHMTSESAHNAVNTLGKGKEA